MTEGEYMHEQANLGLIAERVDDMEWGEVVDTLTNRGFDVCTFVNGITGLDPEVFEDDPIKMVSHALRDRNNRMFELKVILVDYLSSDYYWNPPYGGECE